MPETDNNGMGPVVLTVAVAAALWFFAFYIEWGNFWVKIACSATLLAVMAAAFGGRPKEWFSFTPRDVAIGLVSAAVLYFVFYVGNFAATKLFSFAQSQVGGVYAKGEGTPVWVICLLLFFVTGPAEEIYWRGFLQKRLAARLGGWQGWLVAAALYAGVHVWALNFMLIGAAGVAGLFWGAMYWRLGRVPALIISHSIWSTVIFAVFPIR
ncbi:MAG: CPBP family intramembrane glutamic endopeptidase [Desulfatibacillaceae bacterium]